MHWFVLGPRPHSRYSCSTNIRTISLLLNAKRSQSIAKLWQVPICEVSICQSCQPPPRVKDKKQPALILFRFTDFVLFRCDGTTSVLNERTVKLVQRGSSNLWLVAWKRLVAAVVVHAWLHIVGRVFPSNWTMFCSWARSQSPIWPRSSRQLSPWVTAKSNLVWGQQQTKETNWRTPRHI